jgi:hypothetical protein
VSKLGKNIFCIGLLLASFLPFKSMLGQLTIDPGGLVSIKDGSTMYIGMDFKINAIDGSSGYFSDQTSTPGDVTVTGNVSIERYMAADIWHNAASPVSNESMSVYTGSDDVWYYDESLILNDWNFGWVWMTSGNLAVPRGYDVYFDGTDVLVDYTGTGNELNTGSYSIAVSNTNSTPTEVAAHKGWNLVANPYPSPVDWQASSGWNKSNINDAKYIWDGTNTIYTIWVGGGAPIGINGGTQYIPSNQGFWVQAVSNGNFGMNNAVRTGFITGTPDYYKETEVFDYPLLSLVVTDEYHSDEAVIRFIEGNTEKFDLNYDASKLFSMNPDVPQISLVHGKEAMALNTFSEIQPDLEQPMNFRCAKAGFYSIQISDRTNLSNDVQVYLKDKLEDKMINLSDIQKYRFYHDPFNEEQRFVIYFNPSADVINNLKPENYYSVYSNKNKVFLVKNSVKDLTGDIYVYDLHGRQIFHKPLTSNEMDSFTIDDPAGYYIVQVRTAQTVNNSKVVIIK